MLLKIHDGSTSIADVSFKEVENKKGEGTVKVHLKDFLIVDGKIKEVQNKGDGYVVVEFVKAGKKMKTEILYNLAEPHGDVDLVFYPNYEKTIEKLRLSTKNLIKTDYIDSK